MRLLQTEKKLEVKEDVMSEIEVNEKVVDDGKMEEQYEDDFEELSEENTRTDSSSTSSTDDSSHMTSQIISFDEEIENDKRANSNKDSFQTVGTKTSFDKVAQTPVVSQIDPFAKEIKTSSVAADIFGEEGNMISKTSLEEYASLFAYENIGKDDDTSVKATLDEYQTTNAIADTVSLVHQISTYSTNISGHNKSLLNAPPIGAKKRLAPLTNSTNYKNTGNLIKKELVWPVSVKSCNYVPVVKRSLQTHTDRRPALLSNQNTKNVDIFNPKSSKLKIIKSNLKSTTPSEFFLKKAVSFNNIVDGQYFEADSTIFGNNKEFLVALKPPQQEGKNSNQAVLENPKPYRKVRTMPIYHPVINRTPPQFPKLSAKSAPKSPIDIVVEKQEKITAADIFGPSSKTNKLFGETNNDNDDDLFQTENLDEAMDFLLNM